VREGQPGRDGGDLQGAPFSVPVAFLADLAGDGTCRRGRAAS
jgi:hypothetical protein